MLFRIRVEAFSGCFRWLGGFSRWDGLTPPPPLVLDVFWDGGVSLELLLALAVVGDEGFELAVEALLVVEVVEVDGLVNSSEFIIRRVISAMFLRFDAAQF